MAPERTTSVLRHSGVDLLFLWPRLLPLERPLARKGCVGLRRCWVKFSSFAWFIAVSNVPGCCILASTLPPCVCGMFTENLHCIYPAMRGKNVRVNRWFRQARTTLTTASGKVAKSARCCSPKPSRRSAIRTMGQ